MLTDNGVAGAFSANLRSVTPAFLRFGDGVHITAEHAEYSYLRHFHFVSLLSDFESEYCRGFSIELVLFRNAMFSRCFLLPMGFRKSVADQGLGRRVAMGPSFFGAESLARFCGPLAVGEATALQFQNKGRRGI